MCRLSQQIQRAQGTTRAERTGIDLVCLTVHWLTLGNRLTWQLEMLCLCLMLTDRLSGRQLFKGCTLLLQESLCLWWLLLLLLLLWVLAMKQQRD